MQRCYPEDKSVKVPVPCTCLNCSDFVIVTMQHLVPQLPISVCTEKRLSKVVGGLIGLGLYIFKGHQLKPNYAQIHI